LPHADLAGTPLDPTYLFLLIKQAHDKPYDTEDYAQHHKNRTDYPDIIKQENGIPGNLNE